MVRRRVVAPIQRNGTKYAALKAAKEFSIRTKLPLRRVSRMFNVSKSQLHRAISNQIDLLATAKTFSFTFSEEEEQLLVDSVSHFSNQGTPLSRECFKDLVQFYVNSMPRTRQLEIKFTNNRPGDRFVRNVIARNPRFALKRRSNLEKQRAIAMSPEHLAEHFARLRQTYQEYSITSPEQIFNIDESGFSTRTASRARNKAIFDAHGRSNSVELKWAGNAGHVTIMPVVSADGRLWSPVVVLPGARSKYRIRADGKRETPSDFLPLNAKTVYRDPAGVDGAIFLQWVESFVNETQALRRKHKYIVLTMDGYGAHCTYRALQMMRDHNIIAVGLPAHTSHRTQVLDYTVFSPFKNRFRNMLNERTLRKGVDRNDIYTLSEILNHAYDYAVRYSNIVRGFSACGIWDHASRGPNHKVISQLDITNIGEHEDHSKAYASYLELVEDYTNSRNLLDADGEVIENGTLNTRAGALLTSDRVLTELRNRDEARREAEQERLARAREREAQRQRREQEAVLRAEQQAERAVQSEERRRVRESVALQRERQRVERAAAVAQRREDREMERLQKLEERKRKAAERENAKARRAVERAARQAQEKADEERHEAWLAMRETRQVDLSRSRPARRAMARLRVARARTG